MFTGDWEGRGCVRGEGFMKWKVWKSVDFRSNLGSTKRVGLSVSKWFNKFRPQLRRSFDGWWTRTIYIFVAQIALKSHKLVQPCAMVVGNSRLM